MTVGQVIPNHNWNMLNLIALVILHCSCETGTSAVLAFDCTSTVRSSCYGNRNRNVRKLIRSFPRADRFQPVIMSSSRIIFPSNTMLNGGHGSPANNEKAIAVILALARGGSGTTVSPSVPNGTWILPASVCATAYALYNLFIKRASSSETTPIDPILGGVLLQLVAATMGASLYVWKNLSSVHGAAKGATSAASLIGKGRKVLNGGVVWSIAAGIAVGAAEILSFIVSGMGVPASKSIPTIVGGSVVIGTLVGSFWLKERLSVGGWMGVLLIAIGITLVGIDPGSAGGHL